jgi:hypothetical protein
MARGRGMLIEIKSWIDCKVLFSGEFESVSDAVVSAAKSCANLTKADLAGSNLYRANLTCANLYGANLAGADLTCANLTKANLAGSNLYGANLAGANLTCANLAGADLTGANLYGANLAGANLTCANLAGADLTCANLAGADLTGANLTKADLTGANLAGADLTCANLAGADLDLKYCFLSISPIGSENGCLWVMRGDDGILKYNRGCFSGTEQEFVAAVKKKHAGTPYETKYLAAVEFIKCQLSGR